jgi:MoxR-like ATPase
MKELTPEIIIQELDKVNYFITIETATIIFLAMKLKRPIFIEGPAGVGKTTLAKAISKAFSYEFLKLQCYDGIDESKALYDWEYSKQLLYTQVLKEKLNKNFKDKSINEIVNELKNLDSLFFSENFLIERPLLKAIKNKKPTILLIDEIDKSEPEFEAFLLEILSDFEITIPEIGTIKNNQIPMVLLTSNGERTISDALRRRALFLYLDYPDKDLEKKIIKRTVPNLDEISLNKIIEIISKIRTYPLKKHPGSSEAIEWANSLLYLGGFNKKNIESTINIISKYRNDIDYIKARIEDFF